MNQHVSVKTEARRSDQQFSGGYGYGFIGVLIFSFTLPVTHLVVAQLDPLFITVGRAWIAAIPACLILWLSKSRLPTRAEWRNLAFAAVGVVFAWPLGSTVAMQTVPASHGAVVNGLLPLTTALFGAWVNHERLPRAFWLWAGIGAVVVTGFALYAGDGAPQVGDAWLVAAVLLGGMGYAQGAKAARSLGGWQSICWSLAASLPLLTVPTFYLGMQIPQMPTVPALAGFAYLAFGSMFLGFFAWYKGLAIGGIARVGQIQLIQPFLTVVISAWFFAEAVPAATYIFAAVVIAIIAASRYVTIRY